MSKLFLILSMCIAVLAGCKKHYYKINRDTMCMYLKKPDAGSVQFLSSLDGYQSHLARKIDKKTWEVTLPHTSEFTYFYLVDGEVYVPPCRFKENDDFGSENCLFVPGL